ncbi:OmpH family outer membrane protein [Flavobacterium sufflavum]|uniref:OmpH family outer membrane protein n=1 Tax=Flavobacterium sufflavum TaxID=1921138 RepID=A0A437L145_9FLAO|nr:OmpH family outer membrane protein [Flavobacterium sufflavum]RVT78682.1 OmpH family outer membrane protein [Flavobacterium sufflavum]
MQKYILFILIMAFAFATNLNAQKKGSYKKVLDWGYWQAEQPEYEMSLEKKAELIDENILTIKSVKSKIDGFGTLMKTTKPDLYLGKTVKMTAYVKSEDVKSWTGLWMRVDYYDSNVLAFDNMEKRPIKGTSDWGKYEIVLFVPVEATSISYGVLLAGTGQVWFKDVKFEIVDDTVPETGINKGRENKVLSFEAKAKAIGNEIKRITDEEKNALKAEVSSIDKEIEEGIIFKEKAAELKLRKAQEHAANIETKVAVEQEKLNQLVQDKVDGKVGEEIDPKKKGGTLILGSNNGSFDNSREINLASMKFYYGYDDKLNRHIKRTTSQIVFAIGANNLITDGAVENSDFKYARSYFYEWGLTYNTRILKNDNLLHAKYGLSLMYNDLRPTNNSSFEVNGNQTGLVVNSVDLKDSRFRNVNLVVPLHLEFDFTKPTVINDKTYFKSHDSFRLGIGGYFGTNIKSKQIVKYNLDGYKTVDKTRGDFNTSDFIYGLSTYMGYKATSLYLKYDLNPLFKDNAVKQNNVSLGLRFDFN